MIKTTDKESRDAMLISPEHTPSSLVEIVRSLGSGSGGTVFLGKLSGRRLVAVKRVSMKSYEHVVLSRLDHPNIVRLLGTWSQANYRYLCLEYVEGIELFQLINRNPLHPKLIHTIFWQIVSSLFYLHARGLVHGDLKPENILVRVMSQGLVSVKLIDFGMTRSSRQSYSGLWGSLEYAPPEMHKSGRYDAEKAEMWSLGAVLYTMIYRMLPCSSVRVMPSEVHPFSEIVRRLMGTEPGSRPSCAELINKYVGI